MNEKTKVLSQIVMLAMKMQEESDHAVFLRLSGHVDSMNIDIAQSKTDYNEIIASANFYVGEKSDMDRLLKVRTTLEEFIEDGVNTEQLEYWMEEIYHYMF